jgi:hypothetical protein
LAKFVVALIAVHGLGKRETRHLLLADLDLPGGRLTIRRDLRHTVYLDELTHTLAIAWLRERHRLARPFDQANAGERSATDGGYADMLYKPNADSDRVIIDEVGAIAATRGVTRAQVALAWLRRNPVVAAPLVGARTTQQIDDAVASLDLDITDEEARRLETPYTPRYDLQGISDESEMERIKAGIPGYANV